MAYEHKEGQGSLFKNEKQNDRQPDYKGTIVIGGTTYEIAAWEKTSRNGMSYMSLQAALPRERQSLQPVQSVAQPTYESSPGTGYYSDFVPSNDPNEDLPF